MKLFLSDSFSDEEGSQAQEGKTVYVKGSRQSLLELCSFFASVEKYLQNKDGAPCHMHFQDQLESWDRLKHIDVVIELDENT